MRARSALSRSKGAASPRRKTHRRMSFKHLTSVFESHQNIRQFRDRVAAGGGVENDDVSRVARRDAVIPEIHQARGKACDEIETGVEFSYTVERHEVVEIDHPP